MLLIGIKSFLNVLIVAPQGGLMKNRKASLEPFTYLKQTRGKFMGYVLIQIPWTTESCHDVTGEKRKVLII